MPDKPYRPPTPAPIAIRSAEADALWRNLESTRVRTEKRFDAISEALGNIVEDVGKIQHSIEKINKVEEDRLKSAEKRDARIWQVVSGLGITLGVTLIITLVKILLPLAVANMQAKPPTVNDTIEQMHKQGVHE